MVSRLPPRARNRHVGFSTADLDFNNCETSHGFVGILYSSRLILLYSNHLEGRQTVENHLVHIGTNSYRRTHVMTSSISILVHFFAVFIFAEAGLSAKIAKICTQRKFPAIRYLEATLGLVKCLEISGLVRLCTQKYITRRQRGVHLHPPYPPPPESATGCFDSLRGAAEHEPVRFDQQSDGKFVVSYRIVFKQVEVSTILASVESSGSWLHADTCPVFVR